jgi:hypothetical protein
MDFASLEEQYMKHFAKEKFLKFVEKVKTWGEYVSDHMKLVYEVEYRFKFDRVTYRTCVCEVEFTNGKLYLVDTIRKDEPFTDYFDALMFDTLQEAIDFVNRECQDTEHKEVLCRRFVDAR